MLEDGGGLPNNRTIFLVNFLQNGKYPQPWLLNEAPNAIHSMALQGYLGLLGLFILLVFVHQKKIEKLRS